MLKGIIHNRQPYSLYLGRSINNCLMMSDDRGTDARTTSLTLHCKMPIVVSETALHMYIDTRPPEVNRQPGVKQQWILMLAILK